MSGRVKKVKVMKMSKLTFLLLSVLSTAAFAGSYVDSGTEGNPQNNKESETHFYIDLGMNAYNFDQPGTSMPMSVGYADPFTGYAFPTTSGQGFDSSAWNAEPTITLGYQFLTDNEDLQKIFGQQNAIELRAAYFHNSGTENTTYPENYYVNPWFITGSGNTFGGPLEQAASYVMTDSSFDFETTYENIGLYYTGNKIISNNLINSPYIGIDVSYLEQNSNYSAMMYTISGPGDVNTDLPQPTVGSDDLSSYYTGIAFGDKATWLFAKNYGVYGKLGAGVYLMHTSLSASQTPTTNQDTFSEDLKATYTVDTTDDQVTFKAQAEAGINYYFRNNQDQMSPRVTLLAGLDYWNDVAYADNPTGPNEQVKIGYDYSLNPYAGLQLHIPL